MDNYTEISKAAKQTWMKGTANSYESFRENVIEKTKFPYFLLLFLISPVLGALVAIANFNKRGAKTILVFFFGMFGYTLIMRPGADSYDVMLNFVDHFGHLSSYEFLAQMYEVLMLEVPRYFGGTNSTIDEFYLPIVSYIISRFTAEPSWLFLTLGTIYGYFYLKGVTAVYSESRQNLNMALGILFVFFFSFIFLEGINAPRTYTAGWVFFSGGFLYLKTKNVKYIFLVGMAPLVHFGYIAMITPFFVYLFFRDVKYVYITILVISFFASASMSFIEPYLMSTGLGESKLNAYTGTERWDPELRGTTGDNRSFHAKYYQDVAYYSLYFMFFFTLMFSGYLKNKFHGFLENGLAGIAILLLSFANFASIIPVLSNRLLRSFALFALAYLLVLYSKNWIVLNNRQWIIYVCVPFILLFLFTKYSIVGDFTDFRILVSPLAYPFLGDDPVSIKEFIRSLLG